MRRRAGHRTASSLAGRAPQLARSDNDGREWSVRECCRAAAHVKLVGSHLGARYAITHACRSGGYVSLSMHAATTCPVMRAAHAAEGNRSGRHLWLSRASCLEVAGVLAALPTDPCAAAAANDCQDPAEKRFIHVQKSRRRIVITHRAPRPRWW